MKKLLSIALAALTTSMFLGSCSAGNQDSAGPSSGSQSSSEIENENIKRLDMESLAKNIDEIAQYDLAQNKVFGAAYYVYQDGVEFEKCYGTTSLNGDTAVSNTSIFRLASMTKPVTAIAALKLVETGLLDLDDPVDKYIPSFKNIKIITSFGPAVAVAPTTMPTIRHILTHTAGIGGDETKLATMTASDKQTLDASIAFYVRVGLDFEPGTKQQYSGSGSFDVLTKIIEIVSGTDYLTFLQEHVFAPCGMADTTFTPNAEQEKRMVDMHNRKDGVNTTHPMPQGCIFDNFPSTHYLGGAGLVSTLSDYGKFAKMLLNKGATENGRILNESTFKQLCTAQVDYEIMPQAARWGLGVRVITEATYPNLPVGSFGWSGAYGTHFWIDPENKIFAVYMKNSMVDGGAGNESAVNFEKAVYSSFVVE